MDELLKWRDEFPILANTTYMISNSLGAMPRAVYTRMNDYAEAWATRGVRAWEEGWWDMAVTAGDKVGKLIGAGPGEISLHQNVTITEAIVSSCFDFSGPRNKVVMVDLEFPSILYFYLDFTRRWTWFWLRSMKPLCWCRFRWCFSAARRLWMRARLWRRRIALGRG
jgi:kynureninase